MLNAENKIKTAFNVSFSSYLALITGKTNINVSVYKMQLPIIMAIRGSLVVQ